MVAEGAQLELTKGQMGAVVTEDKIRELPQNARNFTQLLTLTPGAAPVSVGQNAGGAQVQRIGVIVFPAINGQRNRSNSFTLDGVYNKAHFQGTYAIAPAWTPSANSRCSRREIRRNSAASAAAL